MLDNIARRAMQSHVKASLKKIPKRVSTQAVDTVLPNPVNFAADSVKSNMVLGKRTLPITNRIIELKELNLEITNRLEILEVKAPPERGGSVKMLDNYSELIDVLKNIEGIL